MRAQIAALEAIQPIALEALAAMRVQLNVLYDLRVRYVEDMAKYAAALKGETGKLAEATTNILARIDLAEASAKQAVAGIQSDIDQIEADKAKIQELMANAQGELEAAQ